jgi:ABC-type multidrug transport system ATPase subunit
MDLAKPYVIETNALSKTYKNVQALRSLDLKVRQNLIIGFLDPEEF